MAEERRMVDRFAEVGSGESGRETGVERSLTRWKRGRVCGGRGGKIE